MYSEDILSARTLAHAIRDGGYYSPEEVADTLENLARALDSLEETLEVYRNHVS